MKKREEVSSWQMAALFLCFLNGSAIVNIPTPLAGAAKNAAWVSLWIANVLGILVLFCILYLHRKFPELTLVQYSGLLIGKALTAAIIVPLLLVMLLMLANIIGDIGGFFKSTMMRDTPTYVFHSLTLLLAALSVRSGIEVIARMFTMLLFSLFIFSMVAVMLASPHYQTEFVRPLFPDGMKPVLHGAYIAWGFPYAEIVLFSMILPFVRIDKEPLGKFMFATLLFNGLSLSIVIVCTIMALGPMAGEIKYSLFTLARLIELAEILEGFEAVVSIALIVGSYMKATIVLFAINLAMTHLYGLPDRRILVFPIAFVSLLLSLTMFRNEFEFSVNVTVLWPVLITVFGVVPVAILALIAALRRRAGNSRS